MRQLEAREHTLAFVVSTQKTQYSNSPAGHFFSTTTKYSNSRIIFTFEHSTHCSRMLFGSAIILLGVCSSPAGYYLMFGNYSTLPFFSSIDQAILLCLIRRSVSLSCSPKIQHTEKRLNKMGRIYVCNKLPANNGHQHFQINNNNII